MTKITNENTVWHAPDILRKDREKLNGHKGSILWFTGLSGSGKSTLAHAAENALYKEGVRSYVLNGDNVRQGLCKDLGFSDIDRIENIRRIGEVANLMMNAGIVVLTAFISPFRRDRKLVCDMVSEGDFIEVYCDTPINICEERDLKGLYKKARNGEIPEFTGINSPYEMPENAEIILRSGEEGIAECVVQVVEYLKSHGRLSLEA